MSLATLLDEHAREKGGHPADWHVFRYECQPPGGETIFYALTGMVAPPLSRGPMKGRPNWKRGDRDTEAKVYIKVEEHREWLAAWEARTGLCSECAGAGEEMASWSRDNGTVMRPCRKCKGAKVCNPGPKLMEATR